MFFVYRNLSRLNDRICMVMAWKNYCVEGSETVPILPLCLCPTEPPPERGPLCVLQFENTVHSYAETPSLSSLLSLNS